MTPVRELDQLEPVEVDHQRRGDREEPVAAQPPGDEVDDPDEQAPGDRAAQPPRPAPESEKGDRRRHQQLGERRLGVEVVDRRLVEVVRRVDGEVHLVEDEAAVRRQRLPAVGLVAVRVGGHRLGRLRRVGVVRIPQPPGDDGRARGGVAERVREQRTADTQQERAEHENEQPDHIGPVDVEEGACARTRHRSLRTRSHRSAASAERAALAPHIPWTPPPGGVAAEQRKIPGIPVAYGSTASRGRSSSCRASLAPVEMSPPT